MIKKIIYLVTLLAAVSYSNNLFSQEDKGELRDNNKNYTLNKDSVLVRNLFFKAESLETTRPDSAIYLYNYIIINYEAKIKNKLIATCYHRIAELEFHKNNDFKNYFKNNFKAIKIFEAINDSLSMMLVYNNQALALTRQNRFNEAISELVKVRVFAKTHNDITLIMNSETLISDCYSSLSLVDSSITILLNLEKQYGSKLSIVQRGLLYSNLGNTYYNSADVNNKKAYLKAIEYANKSLELFEKEPEDPSDKSFALGLIGAAYMKLGKFAIAEPYYIEAVKIEEEQNHITDLNTLYFEMAELQINLSNKPQALLYFFKHDSVAKLIYNENNANSISEMKTLFETEKKEEENKALVLKNELSNKTIQQQRVITGIVVLGFILLSLFAFFIFKGLKKQRKANTIIEFQKQEVQQQKELVEVKQKEILDSIYYAKRIQTALLANKELIDANIPSNFILFKPKDIVSGDFYWATEHNNNFYWAICDSTGHGVPGAFMSLLNIGFLSEAIKEKNIEEPGDVFNYVRERLISSISDEQQKDGMDGVLICYNKNTKRLSYSAANNQPILISNNQIVDLDKDRMPIGKGETDQSFITHKINYKTGDTLYLYTDGYADQFGGPKGKKFKYRTLNESLLNICDKNVNEQKDILEQQFNDWKGNLEQVDDVLLIGIRL